MYWKKVKIYCEPAAIELLSAVLMDNGINGFIINDPNTINELYSEEHSNYAYVDDTLGKHKETICNIEIYFPETVQGRESFLNIHTVVRSLKQEDFDFNLGSLSFEFETADDTLWLNEWKKYFKPIKIGDSFYIKPSWETIREKHNRYVVEIDPANSFGSGTHATTQLCLSSFEKIFNKASKINILDLGCGSGILGIGAALSGADSVTFVDIDMRCIDTSNENVDNNNLDTDTIRFFCGDILADNILCEDIGYNRYHIMFANIMAEILIEMSPKLHLFLQERGYIILSGIITQRLEAIKKAFINEGYNILSVDIKDDWCSVVVQLK